MTYTCPECNNLILEDIGAYYSCKKCCITFEKQDIETLERYMNTPTPKTDAKACRHTCEHGFHSVEPCPPDKGSWVDISFARTLELELAAKTKECEELKKWKDEDPRMLREQIRVADVAFNHQLQDLTQLRAHVEELREVMKTLLSEMVGSGLGETTWQRSAKRILDDAPSTSLARHDAELRNKVIEECVKSVVTKYPPLNLQEIKDGVQWTSDIPSTIEHHLLSLRAAPAKGIEVNLPGTVIKSAAQNPCV